MAATNFPVFLEQEEAVRDANIEAGVNLKQTLEAMTNPNSLPETSPMEAIVRGRRVNQQIEARQSRMLMADTASYENMKRKQAEAKAKENAFFKIRVMGE
jgi:hypothetical protein